jgi:endoglucanase Acf2
MEEELGGLPSFVSPRPANHKAIPALARALVDDIKYSLPENYMKGAGDTYFSGEYSSLRAGITFNSTKSELTFFSGKMLAKLGRIIVIAQELRGLAERPSEDVPDNPELFDIIQACKSATLPTEEDVTEAIDRLRQGVEVWLNGTASAPLTFDNSWGGVVSCGCLFNGNDCDNTYPSCPGYSGKTKA